MGDCVFGVILNMCMCVCMWCCMHVHTLMYGCVCMYTFLYIVYVHMFVSSSGVRGMYEYMCVCVYVCERLTVSMCACARVRGWRRSGVLLYLDSRLSRILKKTTHCDNLHERDDHDDDHLKQRPVCHAPEIILCGEPVSAFTNTEMILNCGGFL
eukprot:m.23895 g.23895  ORF g.23895 m.23895 type:complete len:154 (-) comp14390_c0_seq1:568-1029(-)